MALIMMDTDMAQALISLRFAIAQRYALDHGATIGRAQWDKSASLMKDPKHGERLVLVRGLYHYPWTPHSVDLRRPDWVAVLPSVDA